MTVARNKYGIIFLFSIKHCYNTVDDLWNFKGYVQLDCTFNQAVVNYSNLKMIYPLLNKSELCSTKTNAEYRA